MFFFFFFSSRRRHTRLTCDWSSDVCSSDLLAPHAVGQEADGYAGHERADGGHSGEDADEDLVVAEALDVEVDRQRGDAELEALAECEEQQNIDGALVLEVAAPAAARREPPRERHLSHLPRPLSTVSTVPDLIHVR